MTIHCVITKLCDLVACFLDFSYVLAQNGGVTSQPFHPPGSALYSYFTSVNQVNCATSNGSFQVL